MDSRVSMIWNSLCWISVVEQIGRNIAVGRDQPAIRSTLADHTGAADHEIERALRRLA